MKTTTSSCKQPRILFTHQSTTIKLIWMLVILVASINTSNAATSVFINEIHYDNTGADAGEAIEVAGPAGTDLAGWSIVLYNGNGGAPYNTVALSGVIADQQNGYGTISFAIAGIQNGSPDGIALIDAGAVLQQFLSYEGSFVAVGGPANGLSSTDIGKSEASGSAVGDSLQLTGSGSGYEDFSWADSQPSTFDAVNTGQTFITGGSGPTDPIINEFVANHTGGDTDAFIEVLGDPATDYSAFTVLEIEGDTSKGNIDAVLPIGTTNGGGYWIDSEDMENGTITILLVEGFTGSIGNDIDTDDDGAIDFEPWTRIVDSVAVYDGDSSDLTYSSVVLGPNYDGVSGFAPGGASRIPDGTDTDTTADWVRNDFDLFGIPGYTGSPGLGEAVNTPGATNVAITVLTDPLGMCGDPATLIHDIQGSGPVSTDVGSIREVEAVVTAVFQGSGYIGGYFLQEENSDADGDSATSEGLRIFDPANTPAMGDVVRVRGSVTEFSGLTEINNVAAFDICGSGIATAATVNLPVSSLDAFEAVEGMAVTFPQALVISEYFNFDRFNDIVLTSERHLTPTAEFEPGPDAIDAAAAYLLDQIMLDDGRTGQNLDPAIHPNGLNFDLTNLFRGGDTVENVTGVMDYAFGRYRIQPTQGADHTNVNLRTDEPDDVGGSISVASFNVLNYFSTLDDSGSICGPLENQRCRGADNAEEFTRQRDKIISALSDINADVVGLMEIENNLNDEAVQDLVDGLNDFNGPGTWDFVDSGVIGSGAIKQALIYQPATVSLLGDFAILDSSVDPGFDDTRNRPVLAQSFVDNSSGGVLTVAVNHLKSKGSSCAGDGDPDLGDGAGNCNLTRTSAAAALVDWLATDPTGSNDSDSLIIGDLNAYDKEDPIDVLTDGGFTDLQFIFGGEAAYSYVFSAAVGYLDYALASPELFAQTTGTAAWHINADEADLINYDTSFKKPNQAAIYAPDAYRASDHDPVISGFELLNYGFMGFFPPIDNLPALNNAKAGSSVPIKFSLNSDYGLDVLVAGYPKSQEIACDLSWFGDSESTVSVDDVGLTYDAEADQYKYVWKTSKEWAGTCRQLIVLLNDGSLHYANFQFK